MADVEKLDTPGAPDMGNFLYCVCARGKSCELITWLWVYPTQAPVIYDIENYLLPRRFMLY